MANYRSITSDPISVLAGWQEWNGLFWAAASTIPSAGDVVYANGFNKEIDQDWTVSQIRNDVFQGTANTGRFEILSAGITFDGERVATNTNTRNEIMYVSFGGGTSYVNGGANTDNQTGNNGTTLSGLIIEGQAGGKVEIETNGDITVGSNNGGYAISCLGNGAGFIVEIITINGQPFASSTSRVCSGMVVDGSFYNINILGVVSPMEESRSTGLWLRDSGNTVNLYGSALPVGANEISSQAIIDTAGNNTINVFGSAYSNQFGSSIVAKGNGSDIISTTNSTVVALKAGCTVTNNGNFNAIVADNMQVDDAVDGDVQWSFKSPTNNDRVLYTAGLLTGYPAESDVKLNVDYGPIDEFTGTYDPDVVNVAQLAVNLLDEIQTSSHVVAQRLRNSQTPEINQQQLTATLGG